MTNLTITVDEETLLGARGQSRPAYPSMPCCGDYLEAYAGVKTGRQRAIADLLQLAAGSQTGSAGTTWTRDDLHERA